MNPLFGPLALVSAAVLIFAANAPEEKKTPPKKPISDEIPTLPKKKKRTANKRKPKSEEKA